MIIAAILVAHFIADFVCQPRFLADTKHRDNVALITHIGIYTLVMLTIVGIACIGTLPLVAVFWWALLNGVLHFATDYVTSRLFHQYWETGHKAAAINIFGFDQLLHYLCLFKTIGII